MIEYSAAMMIGERVLEMADRLRTGDKFVPGMRAVQSLKIDGVDFEIALTVDRLTSRKAAA